MRRGRRRRERRAQPPPAASLMSQCRAGSSPVGRPDPGMGEERGEEGEKGGVNEEGKREVVTLKVLVTSE